MFEYTGCGLPGIYLKNGYEVVDTPYGQGVSIEDVAGLHRAIAADILSQPSPMTGQQFRFLRKELDMVQPELAAVLRVDTQTVANYEKKAQGAVPGPADIALRSIYAKLMAAAQWFEIPEAAAQPAPAAFAFEAQGWVETAAA